MLTLLVTPTIILWQILFIHQGILVPEWYFLPFYAILRSIPHKTAGILAMLFSLLVLFVLPFINTSLVKNSSSRLVFKIFYFAAIGDFLAMFYTPHVDLAFASIEFIMKDVNNGWLIRYIYSNGASLFFLIAIFIL